jgi:branched-chain amino acid transport system ATP-binding protein
MAEALIIRNISKRFGGLRAVQDLDFSVGEGETVALIGPNGAGKTTSFNLITGFHRPDSGSVLAFGRELSAASSSACAHTTSAPMGWRAHFRSQGPLAG